MADAIPFELVTKTRPQDDCDVSANALAPSRKNGSLVVIITETFYEVPVGDGESLTQNPLLELSLYSCNRVYQNTALYKIES